MGIHRNGSPSDPGTCAVVHCPAKLNLFLEILARRTDGFHELDTVMMAVDWCDRLEVRTHRERAIQICCHWAGSRQSMAQQMGVSPKDSILDLPEGPRNLVYQALAAFQSAFQVPSGFGVVLEKHIPAGAGMGGASSDAAGALRAAAAIHGVPPDDHRLHEIAAKIGSDVPFFMGPDPSLAARATGTGTHLHPFETNWTPHAVIVFPGVSLTTAKVYRHCKVPDRPQTAEKLIQTWQSDQPERICELFVNRLTEPAKMLAPPIEEALESMRRVVGPFCHITGSGSACFALTHSLIEAESLAKRLRYQQSGLVRAVSAQFVPAKINMVESS